MRLDRSFHSGDKEMGTVALRTCAEEVRQGRYFDALEKQQRDEGYLLNYLTLQFLNE